MTIYGYARLTTDRQGLADQVKQLRAAGADPVLQERDSGESGTSRPALARAIRALVPGDVLVVTHLDRLARSVRELLSLIEDIRQAGAGFRSLADKDLSVDPASASGRRLLGALGSLAAFERESLLARATAGRRAAREAGVKFGPKPKLDERQVADAIRRRDAGESLRSLAKRFKVSHPTLSRRLPQTELSRQRRIDPQTELAARAFLRHLAGHYTPVDALVFGSRARGTHRPDSDADIAIILKGKPGDRTGIGMDMAGIAVDVLDETGILVSPLPLWAAEFERPELFSNPALIEAIRREGLRL